MNYYSKMIIDKYIYIEDCWKKKQFNSQKKKNNSNNNNNNIKKKNQNKKNVHIPIINITLKARLGRYHGFSSPISVVVAFRPMTLRNRLRLEIFCRPSS